MAHQTQEVDHLVVGKQQLFIRCLEENEIVLVAKLGQKQGWLYSVDSLRACYQYYPGGFHGAFLEDGTLISHCAALPVDEAKSVYNLSNFITSPPYRGQGIGKLVFNRTLASTSGAKVCLDAAENMPDTYARWGFKRTGLDMAMLQIDCAKCHAISKPDDVTIDPISEHVAEVLHFDRTVTETYDRAGFSNIWFKHLDFTSKCALVNKTVVGYVSADVTQNGIFITPLYANDIKFVLPLLQAVAGSSEQRFAYIYVRLDKKAQMTEALSPVLATKEPVEYNFKMCTEDLVLDNMKVYGLWQSPCTNM